MFESAIRPVGGRHRRGLTRTMKRDRLAAGRALGVPTRIVLLVALLAMAGACATPVGVTRQDPKVLYRALSKSGLSAAPPSTLTEQCLGRRGLDDAFENNPEAMLAELHRTRTTRDSDRLFALAELSFLHGREKNKREYVLAAAVYAYAFLVSRERRAETMPAADPRVRWAGGPHHNAVAFALPAN